MRWHAPAGGGLRAGGAPALAVREKGADGGFGEDPAGRGAWHWHRHRCAAGLLLLVSLVSLTAVVAAGGNERPLHLCTKFSCFFFSLTGVSHI